MCHAFRHLRELVAWRMPNSRTFENKLRAGRATQKVKIVEFTQGKMEAPPGFEPGMEVLQI
jgi:hypothetical protein